MKKSITRLLSILLTLVLLFAAVQPVSAVVDTQEQNTNSKSDTLIFASVDEALTNSTVSGGYYQLAEQQVITFYIDIPKDDYYSLFLNYIPVEVRNETIDFSFKIDGKLPLDSCAQLSMPINFASESVDFATDKEGNQLTPDLKIQYEASTVVFSDPEGMEQEPYQFYLNQGRHTVEIEIIDGKVGISDLFARQPGETISYQDYLKLHNDSLSSQKSKVIEAELMLSSTSKATTVFCDSSSASVSPKAEQLQVMNAFGGSQWKAVGQDVTWEFNVETSGFYTFNFHYRQNYTNGRSTWRSLLIDGETPFKESALIEFPYSGSWSIIAAGGEEAYRYWLREGKHTLTLKVVLGDMAEVISESRAILSDLNTIYRRLVTILGTNPDRYRDYKLDQKLPDTLSQMKTTAEQLESVVKMLEKNPGKGIESGTLERLIVQLNKMNKYPEECATQLKQFQSNISAFGTWINERYSQPLALDQIEICGNEPTLKKANIFKQIAHAIEQFLYSFTQDYSIVDDSDVTTIEVWALTGRDQVQILKQMIGESFENENEINVNLKLVSESAVLPAISSGVGPDVCMMVGQGLPVNFASRGAVYDLSQFDDFESVSKRFISESVVPFEYNNGTYALPETLTFPMLFYRNDILSELGLEIPKTWEDVNQLVIDLGQSNMEFGYTSSLQNYATLLFQNGGQMYSVDGSKCLLDDATALNAFEHYVSLYREYQIPVTFDFVNRFRTGAMPVAITDYTAYNTLQIFAPEINGLWGIAPVPATKAENGLNNSVTGTVTGCVIFADADDPKACWEYLKWWTDADTQEKYGRRVEEKLGASARYATANTEALEKLPWSLSFYKSISQQMENVRCISEVPGGYFTGRHFDNAYRKAIYQNANPRETLIEYTNIIDIEIIEKRKEFGLESLEGQK